MIDRFEDETFAELMQQLRDGSEDAARRLLDKYGEFIYRAVRRRLSRQLRSKFDSQDFVQSVWASFFADIEQLREFREPEDLIRYLARMGANKVIQEYRRRTRGRRNVNRELRLITRSPEDESIYASNEPTPSETLMARESLVQLPGRDEAEGDPALDPREQQVLSLRAENNNFREIAERLNVSERTARRVVARLLRRLQRRAPESPRES